MKKQVPDYYEDMGPVIGPMPPSAGEVVDSRYQIIADIEKRFVI